MKKHRTSSSTSGFACFVICLFLFIIQMSFSPVTRLHVATTNTSRPVTETTVETSQELLSMEVKPITKPDSLRPPEPPLTSPISCDRSDERYDLCKINGPTVLDPTTFTFYVAGPTGPPVVEKIKPYPRKFENVVMVKINDVTLQTSGPLSPTCQVHHGPPGLVYSAGGYTGNFFHDFNDGFIPLFITVNTIFPDQDFVIVVTESPTWWAQRYEGLLRTFSKHPIVTLINDNKTHCFPNATLGLISHGFMTINQTLLPNSKTMLHFRGHIDKAYGRNHPSISTSGGRRRPRLVLVSRGRGIGRRILNEHQLIKLMEKIGFEVVVFNPKARDLFQDSYALINSSHAMFGVHGAALTHSLFLRPGSVLVQVVPIGVEWAADAFFGRVGRGMGLEYMEYRIEVEESSLVKKYGKDSELVQNPHGLQSKGWPTDLMDIYLKEQEINLNLKKFRGYLGKVYENAKRFMDKEG